jgi:hypothetical protein
MNDKTKKGWRLSEAAKAEWERVRSQSKSGAFISGLARVGKSKPADPEQLELEFHLPTQYPSSDPPKSFLQRLLEELNARAK